jgi:hypothetical protein
MRTSVVMYRAKKGTDWIVRLTINSGTDQEFIRYIRVRTLIKGLCVARTLQCIKSTGAI